MAAAAGSATSEAIAGTVEAEALAVPTSSAMPAKSVCRPMAATLRKAGIDAVLAALGESVKKSGDGWAARCPAHDDRKASLSVNVGDDGKVLLKCHAGCKIKAIVAASGLSMGDLFPAETRKASTAAGKSKIVETYKYNDESGTLLFESVRFEPKDFRQRHPGPDGKPVWNLDGVRLVPYRLPELVTAVADRQTIYIAEGEKDVETLRTWGFAATCNPMGAGKWGKIAAVASEVLRGARVVVIPDDDEPGRKHAQDIVTSLAPVAAEVKVLPTFPGAKDVSGWKENGGTRERLEELAGKAPTGQAAAAGEYDLTTITDEELERQEISPLRWIIPGFVPEGLSILVGNPKAGKSALVLGWGYALAQKLPVMGSVEADRCETLYLALEDNNRRVKDRIRALRKGALPARGLTYVTLDSKKAFRRIDAGGKEQIEQHLDRHPECRLVIIDTWARVKPTKRNKAQQEYDADAAAWGILHEIATRRRIAIVVLHHTRKALKFEGDWAFEISGTSGIAGTVDTIMLFKRTRGETTATLFVAGRDMDDEPQYVLNGDAKTKTWTLSNEAPSSIMPKGHALEIINVLAKQGPLWPREIADALPDIKNVRVYLQRMLVKDIVTRSDRDKYSLTSSLSSSLNSLTPCYSSYSDTESYGVTDVTGERVGETFTPSQSNSRNRCNRELQRVEGEL